MHVHPTALAIVGVLFMQSTQPVEMTSEPHHHLVLQNDHVQVFDVRVPAHAATLQHWHHVDDFWVGLGGTAELANEVAGQPEAAVESHDGALHFSRGGYSHVVRNTGGTDFRNITISLLQPQGNARNRCGGVAVEEFPVDDRNCETGEIFSTGSTIVRRIELTPNRVFHLREIPPAPALLLALDACKAADANLTAGDVFWLPGGNVDLSNPSPQTARLLYFSFPPPAGKARP